MAVTRSHDWVTSKKAAGKLGFSIQHLRLLIRKGEIDATKIGRDWMIDPDELRRFEKSRYRQTPSAPDAVREPVETLFSEADLQAIVNVASVPMRSPFRYPGGKTWLVPYARLWLASIHPKPRLLIEPFAGGGSIGLTAGFEDLAKKVILSELDPDISAVWRVCLNGHVNDLCARIRAFECNPANVKREVSKPIKSDLDRAFQTIVRNRVSRGGILAPGAGLVKEGEAGKGIASRWYAGTISKRIIEINDRAERFEFQEANGLDVIKRHIKQKQSAFFIDPPYPTAGRRLYRYHEIDHERLFSLLAGSAGPVLITYDDSPYIQKLARDFQFDFELVPMKSTHHERKYELLISKDLSWLPTRQAP